MSMNEEVKAKWVDRLINGGLPQGTGYLRTEHGEYCCLGVLCEIAVEEGVIPEPIEHNTVHSGYVFKYGTPEDRDHMELPSAVQNWAGLTQADPIVRVGGDPNTDSLAMINDSGATFEEIADIIEEKL